MADQYSICLLTVMDRLWFHQIILSVSSSSTLVPHKPLTSTSQLHLPPSNFHHEETLPPQQKPINLLPEEEERPTRMNPASRVRSRRSHSTSAERQTINITRSSSMREFDRNYSMISRSLRELELEEVKGFIDLGFIFNKQNMNPRIARVIPGLLKFLDSSLNKYSEDQDQEEDEEEKGIIRPYLSEAWLLKRPNSEVLNFKLPIGAASEMKKHLKFWARTVAFVVHQNS